MPAGKPPGMILQGCSILALEDEPVVALELEDLLEDAGAEPAITCSISGAIDLLSHKRFEGVIVDASIDGATRYRVAEWLLARGVPFVFSTGYREAAHAAPFHGVPTLAKPYSLADVKRAFAEAGIRPAADRE